MKKKLKVLKKGFYHFRATYGDPAENAVFDVVAKTGFTFLQCDALTKTAPRFFQNLQVAFADFWAKNRHKGNDDAGECQDYKCRNTNH